MNAKNKVLLSNIVGAVFVKGGGLLINLFTLPAYLKYFNNEIALGVWFTLLSVLSWILNFDLGIGNGLRNKLVFSLQQNDRSEIKKYISSAVFSISALVCGMMVVLFLIIPFLNWNGVFNVSKDIYTNKILMISMFINIGGIMLQFIVKNVSSILYALQKSALNNFLALSTNALQLVFVLVYKPINVSNALISLSIMHVISVIVPMILVGIVLFATILKDCRPNLKFVTKQHTKSVLGLGGMFFLVQILFMLLMATNEFIISALYTPADVVQYQAYYKIFFLVSSVFSLGLTPLWSMITKAQAEGDMMWLKKLMAALEASIVIMGLFLCAVTFLFEFIIKIWIGPGVINVNYVYCIWFALFSFVMMYTGILNTMINGLGKLKIQMYMFIVAVVIKFTMVGLSFLFKTSWIYLVIANVIATIPYCIVVHVYIRIKLIRNKKILRTETLK